MLSELAKAEGLGHWELWHDDAVNLKDMEKQLTGIMRSRKSGGGGPFASWSMRRLGSIPDHVRTVTKSFTSTTSESFAIDLAETASANASKLADVRSDYETHLAIWADVGRLYRAPGYIRVPSSEGAVAAIKFIWVVPGYGTEDEPTLWWARPGDTAWKVSCVERI